MPKKCNTTQRNHQQNPKTPKPQNPVILMVLIHEFRLKLCPGELKLTVVVLIIFEIKE